MSPPAAEGGGIPIDGEEYMMGIDEAGRGPAIGAGVAPTVAIDAGRRPDGLRVVLLSDQA